MKKFIGLLFVSIFISCFALIGMAQTDGAAPKKVRIGVLPVKTLSVGEGMDAAQFGAGIHTTLTDYLKSPEVELVAIEAKLPSAIEAEAKEKGVEYLISVAASHKKGGGGFGKMFGTVAPVLGSVAPMAGIGGGVAGAVAGSVATTAVMTAATMAGNVKAKDSIELRLTATKVSDKSSALSKQLSAKAKSDGEDIITPLIEQSAQAIIDAATGKTPGATEKK